MGDRCDVFLHTIQKKKKKGHHHPTTPFRLPCALTAVEFAKGVSWEFEWVRPEGRPPLARRLTRARREEGQENKFWTTLQCRSSRENFFHSFAFATAVFSHPPTLTRIRI